MTQKNKIGIIIHNDFATKNIPPYPHPIFLSYETPLRIQAILNHLEEKNVFTNENIIRIEAESVDDSIINLAHTSYHINAIKHFSTIGSGLIDDEIFITEDTFELAKKAIGGAIQAITEVIANSVNQSIALIRPPGHHALREKGSGFCIFNNIANSILYLRHELEYDKRIAIVDIDDHFGDGLVQYFYDDSSVLYFSVHEYDFVEGELGFINELGEGEGIGKNINFPIPLKITDFEFLEFMDILEPVLREFKPNLIIIAAGFDMYYADPIGNGLLTSLSYYKFAKKMLNIANDICAGKLAFILEGGYSLIGLPVCVNAIIRALLNEDFKRPSFENMDFSKYSNKNEIAKIKFSLKKLLAKYWISIR